MSACTASAGASSAAVRTMYPHSLPARCGLNRSAQALALALIFDARRNADAMPFRMYTRYRDGQSDIRGQTSALGPQRIFHDLDQYLVAFGNHERMFRCRRLEPKAA